MTSMSAVTTLFSVKTRDTDMSKVSRQTFDASNAHQIRQFNMYKKRYDHASTSQITNVRFEKS